MTMSQRGSFGKKKQKTKKVGMILELACIIVCVAMKCIHAELAAQCLKTMAEGA
jgi:hypothetical protein